MDARIRNLLKALDENGWYYEDDGRGFCFYCRLSEYHVDTRGHLSTCEFLEIQRILEEESGNQEAPTADSGEAVPVEG